MSCSLDHLDIDGVKRRLIEKAVDGSPRAYLAPLDKGMSGATVWRARWELPTSGAVSALHVFKIGATHKLQREHDAIRSIASVIDSKVVPPILVSDGELSLLRQPFSGGDPGSVERLGHPQSEPLKSRSDPPSRVVSMFASKMTHRNVIAHERFSLTGDGSPLHVSSQPHRQAKALEPTLTKSFGEFDQVLGGTCGACPAGKIGTPTKWAERLGHPQSEPLK